MTEIFKCLGFYCLKDKPRLNLVCPIKNFCWRFIKIEGRFQSYTKPQLTKRITSAKRITILSKEESDNCDLFIPSPLIRE